jgi:hypothetical protein
MVAISTDTPRWQGSGPRTQRSAPVLRLAPAADTAEPLTAASRLLVILGVAVLTLVVVIGTVAFGRVLDGQRGIPAAGSAPAASVAHATPAGS